MVSYLTLIFRGFNTMSDKTEQLQKQIHSAQRDSTALCIRGNNTKSFMGNHSDGDILSTSEHCGIIGYDPSELVIKVRSGTPVNEIIDTLAENNQKLPFEPSTFSGQATIGGTIACNISGPARAYKGSARDYLLGSTIINGRAERMEFGGQVMKNVAGYDASRLMAGALGTLGVILDVSLKVLPRNRSIKSVVIERPANEAIELANILSGKNLPINATCYFDNQLYIRFSSSEQNNRSATEQVASQYGGEIIEDSKAFWLSITEQQHDFFNTDSPLARLSVPATCNTDFLSGEQLIEWSGSVRWIKTDTEMEQLRQQVSQLGGHVTAYKNYADDIEYFHPIDKNNQLIQQRIKQSLDPAGIFNPGRLYKEF